MAGVRSFLDALECGSYSVEFFFAKYDFFEVVLMPSCFDCYARIEPLVSYAGMLRMERFFHLEHIYTQNCKGKILSLDKSKWNVYSVFDIWYNQYSDVRMKYSKCQIDLIALD